MFQKREIDLMYRLLCLIIFAIVIIFAQSIVTLSILALFFVFLTRDEVRILSLILYFGTAITFMACIYSTDYTLFRIALLMDTFYYFLVIPPVDELVDHIFGIEREPSKEKVEEKTEEVQKKLNTDSYYIRFSGEKKVAKKKRNDELCTIYITAHLLLLFIAIVVG